MNVGADSISALTHAGGYGIRNTNAVFVPCPGNSHAGDGLARPLQSGLSPNDLNKWLQVSRYVNTLKIFAYYVGRGLCSRRIVQIICEPAHFMNPL